MAMDTPATIAILGAGPTGIEAGLYARYLGYDVIILERAEVAAHVLAWSHVRLFSPFSQLVSPLGLAALGAQDPAYRPPSPEAQLTGRQWAEQYLIPLSQTDLLSDHVVCGARVVGVTRPHSCKPDVVSDDHLQSEDRFRILLEHSDGRQSIETADVVIDATGVHGPPCGCGAEGLPARGESRLRSRIEYSIPDVLTAQRAAYEARRILVIGNDLSTAVTVVALAELVRLAEQTDVTWVTQSRHGAPPTGPITVDPDDALPQRKRIAEAANQLLQSSSPHVTHRAGTTIEAIEYDVVDEQFVVTFDTDAEPIRFDRLIANVGRHPDRSLYEELQVRECPRTGGPWGVSQALERDPTVAERDGLHPADRLITTEPHFYILGAKSYGRDPRYLMTAGFSQIRDLFALIGDRAALDLYAAGGFRP